MSSGKVIFLTGGSGFLGQHFIHLCSTKNWRLKCLARHIPSSRLNNRVQWIKGSLEKKNSWKSHLKGCDTVVHLAAVPLLETDQNPELAVKVMIAGLRDLLEEGRKCGIKRFIIASTAEAYGSPDKLPVKESQLPQPLSLYGFLKLNADLLAQREAKAHNLSIALLRFFNLYGPTVSGELPQTVVKIFIDQLLAGKAIILHASKKNSRDFIFVTDAARAIISAIEHPSATGIFNIASGEETFLLDLARKISKKIKRSCRIDFKPDQGRKRRLKADVTKANKFLGFKCKVSLDKGLNEVLKTLRK